MGYFDRLAKKADRARLDLQDAVTGGASSRAGDWIAKNTGIPTSINDLRGRVGDFGLGGMLGGAAGYLLGKGLPKGGSVANGCGDSTNRKGKKGRHYTFAPRITIAAAAQTQNTSRGDFMALNNSFEVAATGFMPFDFDVDTAQLVVGVQLAAAAAKEDVASVLGSGMLVIKEQGSNETSRVPLLKLNPIYGYVSTATAASVTANTVQLVYSPSEFELDLNDGDETHLEVHFSKTFTTVNVIELALILEGTRSKRD